MCKVSIIVPVYNSEKYLEKCVNSILIQSLKEIEVILVDDGSTDSSLPILEEFRKKDERVKIITQQNLFAGTARNNGLKIAQGEYVIFWDSDDYFAQDALEVLYMEAKRCEADICVGESLKMDGETGEINVHAHYLHMERIPEKRPFNIEDIPQYIFNFSNNSPWNKLYRRKFLEENDLKFQIIRGVDDVYFVMTAFAMAKKITIVENIIVYYQFRQTNLSADSMANKEYVCEAYGKVKSFLEERQLWENSDVRRSYINKTYSAISGQLLAVTDYKDYCELLEFYKKRFEALGIGLCDENEIYASRHYRELTRMLTEEIPEFVFGQYIYYQEKNTNNRNRCIEMRKDNRVLRKDYQRSERKLDHQKEIIERLKEKNTVQEKKIAVQKEKIERLREKVKAQKELVWEKDKIIKQQQAYLDRKLVKMALKICGIDFSSKKIAEEEE